MMSWVVEVSEKGVKLKSNAVGEHIMLCAEIKSFVKRSQVFVEVVALLRHLNLHFIKNTLHDISHSFLL